MLKEYFEKLIKKLEKKEAEVREQIKASKDADEVRSMNNTLDEIREELREATEKLADCEKEADEADEQRETVVITGQHPIPHQHTEARRGNIEFNPLASYGMSGSGAEQRGGVDTSADGGELSTMEYRTAFMNYVQKGTKDPILKWDKRADATGIAADLGVLIPMTVIQKIIEEVEKVYGQLYSRVLKTNIKGGVKYPIGSFGASFRRITETTISDRQKGGEITGYVEFSYNLGEIRIAQTFLQTVLSVAVFEQRLSRVIVEAYIEAMDKEIMRGVAANGQMEGILTEIAKGSTSRIPLANVITFTPAQMADWKSWRTRLFGMIPLSMRGLRPEFVMTANTWESNIKTLHDDNNRPLYTETYNAVTGDLMAKFEGRNVVFVEDDILASFNAAANNAYFGMYWVPEKAFAINTNYEFTLVKYFDHETNQLVTKALVVNDGKVLDGKYIYLLRKSNSA